MMSLFERYKIQNSKKLFNSLETLTNSVLHLLLSPLMLIRIPARILTTTSTLCYDAQQNSDKFLADPENLKSLQPMRCS